MTRQPKNLSMSMTYLLRRRWLGAKRWWFRADRRFGVWWRVANFALAVVMLAGVIIPIMQDFVKTSAYGLSANTLKLVGSTNSTLTKQLTYDTQTQTYQFNKAAIQSASSSNPLAQMEAQVGAASGKGKNKSLYALDVPTDFSKGVTYHDTNSGLSFSLVPEFNGQSAQVEQGHLVFPLAGGTQAIYTLKDNGLKEDIVVQKATQDTETFTYDLNLPATLEAKIIPGSNGDIGIYSADPSLFGNISYGSDKDRAAVEKAREKSPKTYLVFGLPSPTIKTAAGVNPAGTSARFQLNGNQLSVVATGLTSLNTPFTIDPSVVVSSASDFQTAGNNEGMISFPSGGGATRGGLTGGGSSNPWQSQPTSNYNGARYGQSTVVYNGYMYMLGGYNNTSYLNDVQFAPINSSGVVGPWHYTHNSIDDGTSFVAGFSTGREAPAVTVYDGYLYVIGGYSGSYLQDVQYAPIDSNGTVGAWQLTASLPDLRGYAAVVTYNDYVYIMGGSNGSSQNSVLYAPFNADGTVGTWKYTYNSASSSSFVGGFTNARFGLGGAAYNGYLYITGGDSSTIFGTVYSDVQYAKINADGTVGTWMSTTGYSTGVYMAGTMVYNGYLYMVGGESSSAYVATAQYAPIYANGTVGTWQSTASLTAGRAYAGSAAYNGYLYMIGGENSSTVYQDVQYLPLDPAGVTTAYSQASGYGNDTSRQGGQAVAYNGYFYLMGGENGSSPTNAIQAAPINADGSLGTFSGTGYTNFTTAREYFAATAYQGYMYVMGGCMITYGTSCSSTGSYNLNTVYSAPINSDGTIGTWTKQHNTYQAIYAAQAVAYNGYMYIVGGLSNSVFRSYIQYQAIGAGGSLSGTWSLTTASLPTATAYSGVAVNGNTLYVAGGCTAGPVTCTTTSNNIYYAPISTSGDITTAFTTNATSFTNARGDLGMYIWDGYMYINGGYTNTTYYSDTQYAPINANGSVGSWSTSYNGTLPTARSGFGSTVYNGVLYTAGGYNGSTYYNNIQYASINNGGNGNTGSGAAGTSFSTARFGQSSIAYNGYLYLMGGCTGSSYCTAYYSDVQYAPLNSDGSIGTWQPTSSLISGIAETSAVAYNGYLYVLGGCNSTYCYTSYNEVEYAPIQSNGTVGAWHYTHNSTDDGTSFVNGFTTTRMLASAVVYNGYVYIFGGTYISGGVSVVALNDVQYAPLNSDGTVGTWASTTSFTTARYQAAATVYDGNIYLGGGTGYSGSTLTAFSDVQYAPLSSNGTVGTWTATSSLPATTSTSTMVAYDGYIYVIGLGVYTFINANGSLGPWYALGSNNLTSGPVSVYNGTLYTVGVPPGLGTSTATGYAPLSSIARVGHYSKLIDLGYVGNITSISYAPTAGTILAGGNSSVTYRVASTNGVFGTTGTSGTITGASGGCTGSLAGTRYVWIAVTIDDSYGQGSGGVYPDSAGQSALASLTVNYNLAHPAPNIRLRAGQTLQSGVLSPLDTCYP